MKRNIFLIGMPGAGKTTWGQRIAEHFAISFLDLDKIVENAEGKPVSVIFQETGEPGFRSLETAALVKTVEENVAPFILSCGGGTPLNPANMALMKANGYVIYLNASTDTLLKHLHGQDNIRPLVSGSLNEVRTLLRLLFEKRSDVYEQADMTFSVEKLSVNDFIPVVSAIFSKGFLK